jgi:membrane-bound serine protease (ClpP class)
VSRLKIFALPKYRYVVLILTTLFFTAFCSQAALAAEPPETKTIIGIMVKGEINSGQAALVKRALMEAENQQAAAVLVEIDTFGGLVDAAVSIRDLLVNSKIPTICYIKNRAWSAGALISIANKHIAIAPGGSIGAAEPVIANDGKMVTASEKAIAALKAEFAATANKTGRNPKVAEAMVDKSLGFEGYAKPGQLLALTDYQAIELGYADVIAADREAVLAHFGYSGANVVEYVPGTLEKIVGYLSDPTVKSLLLAIIFLAVMAEIKSAGIGVAALIGLVAAFLFFGSNWLAGLAGWLELFLFLGGIALIALEFIAPSTGMFALGGLGAIFASFFLTLGADIAALSIISLGIAAAIVVFLLLMRKLPSSNLWAKFALLHAQENKAGYVSSQNYEQYLGQTGVAITLLRPAGTIDVGGVYLDAVSEGKFIEPGNRVKVVNIEGNRIVVRLVDAS